MQKSNYSLKLYDFIDISFHLRLPSQVFALKKLCDDGKIEFPVSKVDRTLRMLGGMGDWSGVVKFFEVCVIFSSNSWRGSSSRFIIKQKLCFLFRNIPLRMKDSAVLTQHIFMFKRILFWEIEIRHFSSFNRKLSKIKLHSTAAPKTGRQEARKTQTKKIMKRIYPLE